MRGGTYTRRKPRNLNYVTRYGDQPREEVISEETLPVTPLRGGFCVGFDGFHLRPHRVQVITSLSHVTRASTRCPRRHESQVEDLFVIRGHLPVDLDLDLEA